MNINLKNKTAQADCYRYTTDAKAPTVTTNKDGSFTVRGVADFGKGTGFAAFSIMVKTNADKTTNVKSAAVGENQTPLQMTAKGDYGTEVLINTVPRNETGSKFLKDPKPNGNASDVDPNVNTYPDNTTTIVAAKNHTDQSYKTVGEFNKKQESTSAFKYPEQ